MLVALEGENRKLLQIVAELEVVIKEMKKEKKLIERSHLEEIRGRIGKSYAF